MANKSLANCKSPGERGGWKTTNYDVYNRQFRVASLNRLSRHPLSVFDYVINGAHSTSSVFLLSFLNTRRRPRFTILSMNRIHRIRCMRVERRK